MAWQASNSLTAASAWDHNKANALANDDRTWGGNTDAAGYNLANLAVLTFAAGGYINSDLGIGTASPVSKLEVQGAGLSLGGTAYGSAFFCQNGDPRRGVILGYDTSGQIGLIGADTYGQASILAFYTYSGAAHTERLRITGTGRLKHASLTAYADNAAAVAGGLVAGEIYWTATGEMRIVVA